MFSKQIIDSDAFLDMPLSAQALYFHLSMRADDDGFINNPKKIQRMIGGSDDDLKLLIAKNFIIPFESGIVVIKHWKIHNYIRSDRKKETSYVEEMALLDEKENGSYTLKSEFLMLESPQSETPRQKAYRESSLPYSFEYKIRNAFVGEICPVCGCRMQATVDECGIATNTHKPSIQHNTPISKGGKHELGNISVICHQCNISIQDTETDRLNADDVIKKWDEICKSDTCQADDSQVTDKCQHRIGKDRIGKDRIEAVEDRESATGELPSADYNDTDNDPENKLNILKSSIWNTQVILSDKQMEDLLNKMGYEMFEEYRYRLGKYKSETGYAIKSDYQTMLKWYNEDRGVMVCQDA